MKATQPNEYFDGPQMTQMDANTQRSQNHLRASADHFRPREIEVHIEELVLHGFQPNDRWRIGDALEIKLHDLLATKGLPDSWRNNPEKVDAGTVRLTNPRQTGAQIAAAIHGRARG